MIFCPCSVQGLEFSDGFCISNSLSPEIWSCSFPLSHKVLDFSTNWFSAPLSARGLKFFLFFFSFAWDLKLFFPSFAQGFGFFNKLILCPSVRARFRVFFLKNDTSILFRTRFEADLWYFYPPPPEVLKLIFIYWYFYPLLPEILDFSQIDSLSLCPREV